MNLDIFLFPLIGGAIIGSSAVLMMWFNGRILGVSGFAGALIARTSDDRIGRLLFIVGIVLTGAVAAVMIPAANPGALTSNPALLIPAGLAVGFGTRLGGGCTSGHGVCGIARLSDRSLTATFVFMLVAVATVYITRHVVA
ncbi:MAG: YeeE/YedE family protein [Pseudomonadota bacterium]